MNEAMVNKNWKTEPFQSGSVRAKIGVSQKKRKLRVSQKKPPQTKGFAKNRRELRVSRKIPKNGVFFAKRLINSIFSHV